MSLWAGVEERVFIGAEDADRHDRAKRISWFDMGAISSARVLMVGAGAIGNEVGKNLALSGFGDVTVVDMDRVVSSNLARCIFFTEVDALAGTHKAELVASGMNRLAAVNIAEPVVSKIEDWPNGAIGGFDVVLGCLDNILARLHLNAACWHSGTPYIDGAMDGLRGKVQVVIPPITPCLECGMNLSHGRVVSHRFSCTGNDISYFLPKVSAEITTTSVIGATVVRECLKLVCGKEEDCIRNVAYYDGLRNIFEILGVDLNPDCPNHGARDEPTG